jgi:PIN domain nuclease of toxin-antitoxin system
MKILLDTHVVVHAANDTLQRARKLLLDDAKNELFISAVTLWEITKLVEIGHLVTPDGFEAFMRSLCGHPRYTLCQYDADLMIELLRVAPRLHKDPADQIIVATARRLAATLMTDDVRIRRSRLVDVV